MPPGSAATSGGKLVKRMGAAGLYLADIRRT